MSEKTSKKSGKSKSSSKKVLPPFGLAEDVLSKPKTEGSTLAPESAALEESLGESIYSFAERMNSENQEEQGEAVSEGPLETWVTFALADESFGLPVSHVQEILRVGGITRVPQAPRAVRGITNVRGRVIPVVDLRARLGLDDIAIGGETRILVVESRNSLIGFLVESVQQVVRLRQGDIQPAPADIVTPDSNYYLGVIQQGEALLILLDADRILELQGGLSEVA